MIGRTLFTNDLLKSLTLPDACRKQTLQLGETYQKSLWRVTTLDDIPCMVLDDIIQHSAKVILRLCRRDSFNDHESFTIEL